jgi:hypothetical protein
VPVKAVPVSAMLMANVAMIFFTAVSSFTFLGLDYRYFLRSYITSECKGATT